MDIKQFYNSVRKHNSICFLIIGIVLCILAACQYFTNLLFYSCFVDDEFQSAEAALSVVNTGTTDYIRSYPTTWILARWIKLFGFSEVSCRSLSAVYGIIAVASVVYISMKLCNSLGYTIIAGLAFIAEPILTYYFRFTRMYSLAVLICLWLYYLIYRGFTKNILYLIFAIPIMYLAYKVHVNCLIMMLGVVVFIIINAVISHERVYVVFSILFVLFSAFSFLNYIYFRLNEHYFFNPLDFYETLTSNVSMGLNINPQYILYILGVSGFIWLSAVLIAIVIGVSIKERKVEDELLYISSIAVVTTIFFWYFSDRYFTEQYILVAVPFAIMMYAFSYIKLRNNWPKISYAMTGILVVIYLVSIAASIATFAKGDNPKNMDYRTAYSKIGDYYDLEEETVPVINSLIRTYYSDEIIDHMQPASFDRDKDMDFWLEFGNTYPEGIVTVEWLKMPALTQGVPEVILDWTNRISGEGVDDTGVNVSYYVFLKPVVSEPKESSIVASYSEGDIIIDINYAKLKSMINGIDKKQMLFVNVVINDNDSEIVERFGLYIPEFDREAIHGDSCYSYSIPLENIRGRSIKTIKQIGLTKDMAVYGNGELTVVNPECLQDVQVFVN